uniref:Uncharacterized protein n=1 Tax=viral metagenome TaxID=1070528 RepID=A0A6M3LL16_9ZZZZ
MSLGMHFCLSAPNLEIHIPFGFIRIGVANKPSKIKQSEISKRIFGIDKGADIVHNQKKNELKCQNTT